MKKGDFTYKKELTIVCSEFYDSKYYESVTHYLHQRFSEIHRRHCSRLLIGVTKNRLLYCPFGDQTRMNYTRFLKIPHRNYHLLKKGRLFSINKIYNKTSYKTSDYHKVKQRIGTTTTVKISQYKFKFSGIQ